MIKFNHLSCGQISDFLTSGCSDEGQTQFGGSYDACSGADVWWFGWVECGFGGEGEGGQWIQVGDGGKASGNEVYDSGVGGANNTNMMEEAECDVQLNDHWY